MSSSPGLSHDLVRHELILGGDGFHFDHGLVLANQAAGGVQHPVENLRAAGQDGRVLDRLVRLGEGVAQAPSGVPVDGELGMAGRAPFLEHGGDGRRGDGAGIHGADDEVMNFHVGEPVAFVGGHALLGIGPLLGQQANGLVAEDREVTDDVCGVDPAQHDLGPEGEVVAGEDAVAGSDPGHERLVVAVAGAEDEAHLVVTVSVDELVHPEVVVAVPSEGVDLRDDTEVEGGDGLLDAVVEVNMGDGVPAIHRGGRGDFFNGVEFGTVSATVEGQVKLFHVFDFGYSRFLSSLSFRTAPTVDERTFTVNRK